MQQEKSFFIFFKQPYFYMYLHVSNTQIFLKYHFGLNLSDISKTLIVNRVFHFNDFFLPELSFKEMTGGKDSTATCYFFFGTQHSICFTLR